MGQRSPLPNNSPEFSLVPCQNHIFLSEWSDIRSVLPNSHIHLSHAGWRSSWGNNFSVLFGLFVNDMPSPSRHVALALYADDTVLLVTSHQQALLVKYPEKYLSDLERWLREWRIAINVSKSSAMLFAKAGRCIPASSALRRPNPKGHTTHCLGMNLDTRLTWSNNIDRVRKRQRLGCWYLS
jgi:hypothetical protein